MSHLIIILANGQRIERWTDTPALTEQFYRDAGAYVFEGGEPQPIRTDPDAPDRALPVIA